MDLTPFHSGIEAVRRLTPSACDDPRIAFMNVLGAEGFSVPKALIIGKIQRIDGPDDKHGKRSGWFIYNEIEDNQNDGHIIGVASYGDWKLNFDKTWCSRSEHQMSAHERASYLTARDKMRDEYREAERLLHEEKAREAYDTWAAAPDATSDHAYLKRKMIGSSPGVKIDREDNSLIIPVAVDNQIMSLQFIKESGDFFVGGKPIGNKKLMPGGKAKGGWFVIIGLNDIIYVAEGYATARSIFEATGRTTYIAFSAGNIYETVSTVKARHANVPIVICGDDDVKTTGNPGRTKAEQAAQGLGLSCVFPPGFKDFNDMHVAQGIGALKSFLLPSQQQKPEIKEEKKKTENIIAPPPGILSDIVDYYHATSGNSQHGFALQTALAITSIVLGRCYKTSLENYSSLYLLNVGKTATGKEHAKTVTEKILYESGQGHLIAGDGYTSAGAVFSALLDRPKHISVIDEFGRYLEAGRNLKNGNGHQREANTKLMESIGRAHSVMRPPSYSSMTLKKEAAEAIKNRQVHNPAITLLTMTTPETLFATLDVSAIKDGFVNRFIISISDAERAVRKHKPPIEVPDRITKWINAAIARNDKANIASEPAQPIVLEFSKEALDEQIKFQQYCIDKANALDRYGMAELTGRSNEMAMRVSLICALARDPYTKEITGSDMAWAVLYIKHCLERTVDKLKMSISHSDFEHQKKEILVALRASAENGITWSQMQKTPPFSMHKPKDLRDIMQALKDADLAFDEPFIGAEGGRSTIIWRAMK